MNKYPFDTDALAKGSDLNPETIEKAYGVSRGEIKFRWILLRARRFVSRSFADRGEVVTVQIVGDGLHICTDDEQFKPNTRSIASGQRKMRRAHGRMVGANRSQMSSEIRDKHDRAVEVNGRKLAAMKQAGSEILPDPTQRQTPSLSAGRRTAK